MSRHRAPDPQPTGRSSELAALALAGTLTVLALAASAGLGTAAAWFGGGWVWPRDTPHLITTVAGLLSGHPGRGLPAADAARVPGPWPVYACVAAAELLTLAVAAAVAVVTGRFRTPGDARRGMATRAEAARVLGVRRLRGARAVIRPDLYGTTAPDTNQASPPAQDIQPQGDHR
jgi:hypothetical protein